MTDIAKAILAALQSGPLKTAQIKTAVGIGGSTLGNTLAVLRREGLISREPLTQGRWRYYIGNTAPCQQDAPKPAPKVKTPTVYAIPVRHVDMPRWDARNTQEVRHMRVTLPAEPWRAA